MRRHGARDDARGANAANRMLIEAGIVNIKKPALLQRKRAAGEAPVAGRASKRAVSASRSLYAGREPDREYS